MESTKEITKLKFKLNSGYEIPVIALGTYKIKSHEEIEIAIKAAWETGYRHIDTAVFYQNEEAIGTALKKLNIPREEIFITTKIPSTGMTYEEAVGHINTSLKNLQTNYIDLYLIHWPGAKNLEDRLNVWKALEESVGQGKVRSIGVSNFLPLHLKTILDVCKIKPAVNQIEIHPLYIEHETIEYCKKEGILMEAYSTFGKWDPKLMEHEVLTDISKKYGKLPTQVLVRWAVQHGWVVLPKSSNPDRIRDNFNVDDFELSESDISTLDGMNCDYKVTWNPNQIKF